MNCQIFSTGLSSGDFGGSDTSVMLGGTGSIFETCHPAFNGLTKRSHPCQVMADILTLEEAKGPIKGRMVAWSGDASNVLASWIHAAQRFDFSFHVATPTGLDLQPGLFDWARRSGARLELIRDPHKAVKGADAVVSDC
jgi:ornithine carbamoyltransferase